GLKAMVAGKLLVRPRYPGTGTVKVLLEGRLILRECSAATMATTRDMTSAATNDTASTIFFTSGTSRSLYHLKEVRGNNSVKSDDAWLRDTDHYTSRD